MTNVNRHPDAPFHDSFRRIPGALQIQVPWLTKQFVTLLSSKVRIDEEIIRRIKGVAEEGSVVYALKFRSWFDLCFLRTRFALLGLPEPAFLFDTVSPASRLISRPWRILTHRDLTDQLLPPKPIDGYEQLLKELFRQGRSAVFFLVDERSSRERYLYPDRDPLSILLEIQGRYQGSIAIVPLVILYDRNPGRNIRPFWEIFLGDPKRPGPLKRLLIAFRKWTVPEVLMGEPVYLLAEFEEFGGDTVWDELPLRLREKLIASLDARIRVSRGPSVRSRTEIKELVLQEKNVQIAVSNIAKQERIPEAKVRKTAEAYLDEIAADQRHQVHHFLYHVLKWLFAKVFSGIDSLESDFVKLKRANTRGSLIFVSSHKSHFDYLLLGWLTFVNQMAIPYMAAGKNLSFWPIGSILRRAGAFFLRRSFKGMNLYPQVFAAYVKVLVSQKANINFYIEGGRSRTGKFLPPRLGMLNFLVQSTRESTEEELFFVPTFIGYDQVPEENAYLRELAGREKRQESFWSFLQSRKILRRSFGKVYIRFGEPTSLKDFEQLRTQRVRQLVNDGEGERSLVEDFAHHLMAGIVRASVITPVELAAAGLVASGLKVVSHQVLTDAIGCLTHLIKHRGGILAPGLQSLGEGVQTAVGLFTTRGFLEVAPQAGNVHYRLIGQKRAHLEFYANGLVTHVWPASLLAAILIAHAPTCGFSKGMRGDYHLARSIFAREIIIDPVEDQDRVVEEVFNLFEELGWTSSDTMSKPSKALFYCRGLMTHIFRVYYLALAVAETIPPGTSRKDFMKIMSDATAALLSADDTGQALLFPSAVVENALARFSELGILEYDTQSRLLVSVLNHDELRQHKHFLEHMLKRELAS